MTGMSHKLILSCVVVLGLCSPFLFLKTENGEHGERTVSFSPKRVRRVLAAPVVKPPTTVPPSSTKPPPVTSSTTKPPAVPPSTPATKAPPPATNTDSVSYNPGQLSVSENGLKMSVGLQSKLIAETGKRIRYENGTYSVIPFHREPSGAEIFVRPGGNGWVYVSNSESSKSGGIGALTFNKNGGVVGYDRVVNGRPRNRQGGRTPWNSWITCEEGEKDLGQCWQTDPFGVIPPRQTVLGGKGGNYEAVACDDRDPLNPIFYVTNDERDGELRRFTPDPKIVEASMAQGGDKWDIVSKPGKLEYLVLEPESKTEKSWGYVRWTTDIAEGKASAEKDFRKCKGMEYMDGKLYFVSSTSRALFILHIDTKTYEKLEIETKEFAGRPKGLKMNGDFVYFSESNSKNQTSGVHVLDRVYDVDGEMFTLLESVEWPGDVTGLAFSPDRLHMYVAFQEEGKLFDITRKDLRPFDGDVFRLRRQERDQNGGA